MSQFCHLHCHSEYSLLDGMSKVRDMVKRAKELNQPAIALTDHGVMFGAIEFYRAAKKAEVKPIMGVEAYLAARTRNDRDPVKDKTRYHMLLLAETQQGYLNLLKLCSIAQLEGFYGRPRIDREVLAAHSEGIIATTGCLAAEVPRTLMYEGEEAAYQKLKWYLDVFGRDNFFLELQGHDIEELRGVNKTLIEWSKKYGVNLVATNDVHYVRKEDADPHDALLCIQTHDILSKDNRMRLTPMGSYYITSFEEMMGIFGDYPEALQNTVLIAERCNVDLEHKGYHLPQFPIPAGFTDAEDYLKSLVMAGIKQRYGDHRMEVDPILKERVERELFIIHNMGFDNYFLIVWDLCRFAAEVDIWWNVRGSGAGSVVAYALRITNIDPIKNDLIFERFLNPDRVSMPDIDIDFPDDRRSEMIEYTVRKYGAEKVAAIITFGTLGARAAVRDVGRVLEIPLNEVDRVARFVPNVPGKPVNLDKLLFDDAMLEEWPTEASDLREVYRNEPQTKRLLDMAMKLEGQTRHASTHAAGIVISDKPIVEYAPLHRPTKGDDTGPIQQVVQFDMNIVESIGLLKVDFLGLATITIMRRACELIEQRHGRRLDMNTIPYERVPDDAKQDKDVEAAFKLLQAGETVGVFQVEGAGLRRVLTEMRPTEFEHIIAAISLYRPGPLEYIPQYIRRMHGQEPIKYHHPLQEPILQNTFGICVYQEQIMRMATDLAGYSPGEADLMRRAVSKKKAKDIEYHKGIFVKGAVNKGISQEAAERIYGDIEFFARYGFNKCVTGDTEVIDTVTGALVKVADLHANPSQVSHVLSVDTHKLKYRTKSVVNVVENGIKPVFQLATAIGHTISATDNHPFYTREGWKLLGELKAGDEIAVARHIAVRGHEQWDDVEVLTLGRQLVDGELTEFTPDVFTLNNTQIHLLLSRLGLEGQNPYTRFVTTSRRLGQQLLHLYLRMGILAKLEVMPLRDGAEQEWGLTLIRNYDLKEDVYWDTISAIEPRGEAMTYDLEIEDTHNFIANNILVHNSHAADYAVITVQTAYLKAHYPVEYLCALLEVEFNDTNKVPVFLSECRRMGIHVLPPDLNKSGAKFTIEPNPNADKFPKNDYRRWAIRVGMGAIKNVGLGVVEYILAKRAEAGEFKTLDDFCERVDLRQVNRRALECLTKVGVFDNMVRPHAPEAPRETMLELIDRMIGVSSQSHEAAEVGQMSMFDIMLSSGGQVSRGSVLNPLPTLGKINPKQRLADEKELLGLYISEHPLQQVAELVKGKVSHFCNEITTEMVGQNVAVAGLLVNHRVITTKKGDRMAFLKLEDMQGDIEIVLFPRTYEQCKADLVPEAILLVGGKVEARNDSFSLLADKVLTFSADARVSFTPRVVEEGMEFYGEMPPLPPDAMEFSAPTNGNGAMGAYTVPVVGNGHESATPAEVDLLEGTQRIITLTLPRTDDATRDVIRLRQLLDLIRQNEGGDTVHISVTLPDGHITKLGFGDLKVRWTAQVRETLQGLNIEFAVQDITPDPKARYRKEKTPV
jgi:DNA-directed DNA polymerase III PolC